MADDFSFRLCLTHDVDRPYKTYQSLYFGVKDRDAYHLRTLLDGSNPYWQFDDIVALEADLGVRSAFYFLTAEHLLYDRPIAEWLKARSIIEHLGRYDVTQPRMVETITALDEQGWEVGLHGSCHSFEDPDRLGWEKTRIENVVGHPISGGRQHYLNISIPDTWRYLYETGLKYDSSLGSSDGVGFEHGYGLKSPFDGFVVFPLTIMEMALPDPDENMAAAWSQCQRLLVEAREHNATMTVLWHLRYFNEREFPGYKRLYRRLIMEAKEMGAWIGTPEAYLETFSLHPG